MPVGLSDHMLDIAVPAAAVALGACIIEKHVTLSRDVPGLDSAFSLELEEFGRMAAAICATEKALGKVSYELTAKERDSRVFRRSLFVVKAMKTGDLLTEDNVHSIRPGYGLAPKHLKAVLGHKAAQDISRGVLFLRQKHERDGNLASLCVLRESAETRCVVLIVVDILADVLRMGPRA